MSNGVMILDVAVNRAAWTAANAEYSAGHAARAWRARDFAWGVFSIAERDLGVFGEVAGLDVVELGCGTAYLSAWLARQEARPVGIDVTHAQLLTARSCQEESGVRFPLIEADAGQVPLAAATFDLAVSECGASLYCEPHRWVAEAARLLRPGGRLVFHTISVLAAMCQPGDGSARQGLQRPQREVRRLQGGLGIEYHPSHSDWIGVLTAAGLVVDALHELYAPPGATDHPYYQVASADWSRQWPVEDIWIAHRPAA